MAVVVNVETESCGGSELSVSGFHGGLTDKQWAASRAVERANYSEN
jgi:hypothetical protein